MVAREKNRQKIIIAVGQPIYQAVTFFFSAIYKCLFWWLDILSQRSENAALQDDIQENLFFLYSNSTIVSEKWIKTAIHPFDYAVVKMISDNIYFSFTRGQDQLNILVSPRHLPKDRHDLYAVLAALDATDFAEHKRSKYLSDIASWLRPRLDALNNAFSENNYSAFREKLSDVEAHLDVIRRQSEWELNKAFYHSH